VNRPYATLAALALTVSLAWQAPASATPQILVPAYFYPSVDPAQSPWNEMTAAAAAGASITAIMNPDNGPGVAVNSDYVTAVAAFRAAGGRVLGYVYTCYGGQACFSGLPPSRTTAQVLEQAARYRQWYSVDGIFLDEMSNRLSDLAYYETVAQGLRAAQPGLQIFGNPGTASPEAYLAVADTLVSFERGTGSYDGAVVEAWMSSADPSRQAHLHYNVDSADTMRTLLQEAQARRAGYVYITDDRYVPSDPAALNPWDQLPAYWGAELRAVAALAVPAPTPAALLALGLGALVWMRRSPR
jgi:hypothetical protein